VRPSRTSPSVLQAKRPPQSIASPGDYYGKDEDRQSPDGAGTGPLAAGLDVILDWGMGILGWIQSPSENPKSAIENRKSKAVAAACDPAATRRFLELLRGSRGQLHRVPGFACRPQPAGKVPPRRRRRLASRRGDPGLLVRRHGALDGTLSAVARGLGLCQDKPGPPGAAGTLQQPPSRHRSTSSKTPPLPRTTAPGDT
jgi:hypothetical protein